MNQTCKSKNQLMHLNFFRSSLILLLYKHLNQRNRVCHSCDRKVLTAACYNRKAIISLRLVVIVTKRKTINVFSYSTADCLIKHFEALLITALMSMKRNNNKICIWRTACYLSRYVFDFKFSTRLGGFITCTCCKYSVPNRYGAFFYLSATLPCSYESSWWKFIFSYYKWGVGTILHNYRELWCLLLYEELVYFF